MRTFSRHLGVLKLGTATHQPARLATEPKSLPPLPVKGKLSTACKRGKPQHCFMLSCSNPEHGK